jgi:hypothetical protein
MRSISSYLRHDISDHFWSLTGASFGWSQGHSWGGIALDNCLFINVVFWIMARASAPVALFTAQLWQLDPQQHRKGILCWRDNVRLVKNLLRY